MNKIGTHLQLEEIQPMHIYSIHQKPGVEGGEGVVGSKQYVSILLLS